MTLDARDRRTSIADIFSRIFSDRRMDLDLEELIEEERQDDDLLLLYYLSLDRAPIDSIFLCRNEEGFYKILIQNHLNSNDDRFRKFCRFNKSQFNFLLSLVFEELEPKTSQKRECINGEEKLFLTLRFVATGETYASLSFAYRISECYISAIIRKVLKLLRQKLMPIAMPPPTENDFKRTEKDFWERWNMPNCVSSIDRKHIRIKAPQHSGSLYFNCKTYFSIVMLALVDANYKFVAVDAGSYGKEGDSNIFRNSIIGKKIASNHFHIPESKALPGSNITLPHFLIGDEAFPLNTYMMRPYPRKNRLDHPMQVYNYRLCRARRVAENAFGLLSQVFRVFYSPIAVSPDTCTDLILVACCFHNLLRDAYLEDDDRPHFIRDENQNPTDNMMGLATTRGTALNGVYVRNQLTLYFNSAIGLLVSWQNHYC